VVPQFRRHFVSESNLTDLFSIAAVALSWLLCVV
jgi:hypothetical protein